MTTIPNTTAWPYGRSEDFENTLRQAAASWFASRSLTVQVKRPYILARHEDWPLNLVDSGAATYVQARIEERRQLRRSFPLHKWVHHGLSSQAMLFNLVGPLVASGDLGPLRTAVEATGLPWPATDIATLEYEDRSVFHEQQVQPTSVDLVVGEPDRPEALFIEAKLVETGFGGCSLFTDGDCDGANPAGDFGSCYLHHIGRTYLPVMETHGVLRGAVASDSICRLANHYQFYRELLLALEKRGSFVLIADHRSPVWRSKVEPRRGVWEFLTRDLPDAVRARTRLITVQEIVAAIEASGRHPWIGEFKRKYALV